MNCQMCNRPIDADIQANCGAYLCAECLASCEGRQGDCTACQVIE